MGRDVGDCSADTRHGGGEVDSRIGLHEAESIRAPNFVRKGGRTPPEAGMHLIRHPVKPKRSPLLSIKLGNPKYESWKNFVDNAYWLVDLR